MDSVDQALSAEESQRRDALVGRLFQSVLGAMDLFHVYLGSQLGLYDALGRRGWATSAELAGATQLSERYVREWLEQQAVSGFLDVGDVAADARSRRYTLSPGHAEVLLRTGSLRSRTRLRQRKPPAERGSLRHQLCSVILIYFWGFGPYEFNLKSGSPSTLVKLARIKTSWVNSSTHS